MVLLSRSYSDRPRVLGCDERPAGALQCLVPWWWGRKRRSSKRSIGSAPVGRHMSSSTTHLWSDAYVSVPNNKVFGPEGIHSKEKRVCVFHADGRRNCISLRNRKKLAQWTELMIPYNSSRCRAEGGGYQWSPFRDTGSKPLCDLSSLNGLDVHLLQIIVESQSTVKMCRYIAVDFIAGGTAEQYIVCSVFVKY